MPAAMATMPAARPSRPSMRFTALAMPTTQSTVMQRRQVGRQQDQVGEAGPGRTGCSRRRPTGCCPASTMPAILAGADTSRRSSMSPTTKMTTAAITTPSGWVLPSNTASNSPDCQATAMATRNPASIAAPPSVAVGPGVHPSLVRLDHRPGPHRHTPDDGREDDRHHEGDREDDDVGGHGGPRLGSARAPGRPGRLGAAEGQAVSRSARRSIVGSASTQRWILALVRQ